MRSRMIPLAAIAVAFGLAWVSCDRAHAVCNGGGGVVRTVSITTPRVPSLFKRPYEVWERVKDRLGLDSASSEFGGLPAFEKVDELIQKRDALARKYQASKDKDEKDKLKKAMKDIDKEIAIARITPKEKDARQRRDTFIQSLLTELALAAAGLPEGEMPDFQCSREEIIEDLEKILREIGAETAPHVWGHLSEQVRYQGPDGPWRKAAVKETIKEFEEKRRKLRDGKLPPADAKAPAPDAKDLKGLAEQLLEVEDRIAGYKRSLIVIQRAIVRKNGDLIERLEKLLLDLGPEAVPALLAGAEEANPASAQEALALMQRQGTRVVPRLIEGLKEEKSFRAAARTLKLISRQDLGDDPKAWTEWFEKLRKNAPEKPAR